MPSSSSWFRTAQPPSTPEREVTASRSPATLPQPQWEARHDHRGTSPRSSLRSRVERHVVLRPREPVPLIGKNVIHHILVVLTHRRDDLVALRLVYPRIVGALSDQQRRCDLVRLEQRRLRIDTSSESSIRLWKVLRIVDRHGGIVLRRVFRFDGPPCPPRR